MKLRIPALLSFGLIASCVVMTPITPPPDLEPVAMSGPAGSGRTLLDAEAPSHVPLTRGGTAWLVRPSINGTDVGWLVLDTGVAGMLISPAAAEQAGLTPLGTTRLADGSVTTVFLGETLQLGPWTVRDTRYAGADFPRSHVMFGRPVDGYCAYDLFAQAIFELDIGHERIGIYDPATYVLAEGQWQPLILDHNLPHVSPSARSRSCARDRWSGSRSARSVWSRSRRSSRRGRLRFTRGPRSPAASWAPTF